MSALSTESIPLTALRSTVAAPPPKRRRIPSPALPLALLGFAMFVGGWYLSVDVLALPRFRGLPGPTEVIREWLSPNPVYGTSIFTASYYEHIWASVRRVALAFAAALITGIPLGLLLGWSSRFRQYAFPVFELIRPIPILAWVPLAMLMFHSREGSVIFLTYLAAFYAVTLNTLLGVHSIDPNLIRAARCLGAGPREVLRTVVIPGSLPYIFTGLQIGMGVAWFSLVAGEMIAGQFGLGYLINASYTTTRYPTIVIAMITLGVIGFASSVLIRLLGDRLMAYRARSIGS
ncbi:ABC transporter permease [Mycobacterium colombiense]|uniref:ABC transporter permease n=1 Tax=Mycobacterium colombiense TaxID=339268 RepID=UPI0007FF7AFD|nr:ABC transporter permease [Mycobacterium colombiense]OBJ14632.1 ABC transporter permease [Mycobacterium colombiense]